MVVSMTGYGEGIAANEHGTVKADIKSVNHRFLEPVFRLPFAFAAFEHDLRKRLADKLRRGRVEVRLFYQASAVTEGGLRLDPAAAAAGLAAVLELERLTGQFVENKAAILAGLEGVLTSDLPARADEAMLGLASAALEQALDALNAMRRTEGAALADNVKALCDRLAAYVDDVAALAERVPERQRVKLAERIETLLGEQTEEYYPGQRLAAEVALLVDRMAIDEEIVRLKSHIEQMRTTLGSSEAIGKRLDFLCQEMNREVNTIGSKSGDTDITERVIGMKNEIEKIREQVQNIE